MLTQVVDLPFLGDDLGSSEDLTYFASVEVTKAWRRFDLRLSYLRDASTTSEVGGTVRDLFSAQLSWKPAERWDLRFSAFYEMREEALGGSAFIPIVASTAAGGVSGVAELVGFQVERSSDTLDADSYFLGVSFNYNLSRRTRIFVNVDWSRAELSVPSLDVTRSDRFRVAVGLVFTFDRFQLPI
jgi:hypothetical protein